MGGRKTVTDEHTRGEAESLLAAASEPADALAPLLRERPARVQSNSLPEVVIGELIAITDDGETPLVLYPGQPGIAAVRAAIGRRRARRADRQTSGAGLRKRQPDAAHRDGCLALRRESAARCSGHGSGRRRRRANDRHRESAAGAEVWQGQHHVDECRQGHHRGIIRCQSIDRHQSHQRRIGAAELMAPRHHVAGC